MARFAPFTAAEFEAAFPRARRAADAGGEAVYDLPVGRDGIAVRVYTSLSSATGEARGCGADAIRTVLFDTHAGRPLSKRMARIHRTAGRSTPLARLAVRVRELSESAQALPNRGAGREPPEPPSADAPRPGPAPLVRDVAAPPGPTPVPDGFPFPLAWLAPVQAAVWPLCGSRENVLMATPTNSGKTIAAETLMLAAVRAGRKAAYLAPLRVLSRERFDSWAEPSHPFSGLRRSILTGDFLLTEAKRRELAEADVVVMTSEMLGSRIRRNESESNAWLNEIGCLVVDEAHLLGMSEGQEEGRGHRLEAALMAFTAAVPDARIVAMSATVPNAREIAEWIAFLTGRATALVASDWRAVPLSVHVRAIPWAGLRYAQGVESLVQTVVGTVQEHRDDRFLVFVHAKTVGRRALAALRAAGVEAEFHNADLALEERKRIEAAFRDKSSPLRALVSTSTVAWGCNLPARRVVVCGVLRGLNEVHPYDVIQECGRSGRAGLDDRGDAHVLVQDDRLGEWKSLLAAPPPVRSELASPRIVAFHVVADVVSGAVRSAADAERWYGRSLGRAQGAAVGARAVVRSLVEIDAIRDGPGGLSATGLGRTAAHFYLSPFDVAAWARNFGALRAAGNVRDADIAAALACVPSQEEEYVPRNLEDEVEAFKLLVSPGLRVQLVAPTRAAAAWRVLTGAQGGDGWDGLEAQVRMDAERLAAALAHLDRFHAHWGREPWFARLGLRLRYGVPWELTDLCRLPGIGGKRARALWDRGIESFADFIARRADAELALGSAVYGSALPEAERLARAAGAGVALAPGEGGRG